MWILILRNGDSEHVAASSAPMKPTWESDSEKKKKKNAVSLALIEHKRALSSDGVTVWGVETKIQSFLIKYSAVLDKKC